MEVAENGSKLFTLLHNNKTVDNNRGIHLILLLNLPTVVKRLDAVTVRCVSTVVIKRLNTTTATDVKLIDSAA